MRDILERYARRLTSKERQAIWEAISGARPHRAPATPRWAIPATAMTAIAAMVIVWFQLAGPQRQPGQRSAAEPRTIRESVSKSIPQAPTRPGAGEHVASRAPVHHEKAPRSGATPLDSVVARALAAAPLAAARTEPLPVPVAHASGVVGRIADEHNQPVPFANVRVKGTRFGALSGEDGTYHIDHLPPATYTVEVMALGHKPASRAGIRVESDRAATADVQLDEMAVVGTLEEIQVRAEKRIDTKSSTTKHMISAEKLRELPVDNLSQAIATKPGVVSAGDGLHFRGGRSGEAKFQLDGAPSNDPLLGGGASAAPVPAPPPVIPTTGGTKLPNDEPYDSMFFKNYGVNPFVPTDEDALSTFAVDVDAASYTVMRRYIELGHLPPADAVRVEEFVNFFSQGYPRFDNEDFRIMLDGAPSPFGAGYQLLRVGIKGREISEPNRKPAQLTFVIDVSGSMAREDRIELVKRALRLLVDQLRGDDRVGIVVFGTTGRVLLEPRALGRGESSAGRRELLDAIDQLRPEGSTNTEDGLKLGYQMARRAYRPGAINRIVLCADGVANEGRTGPESILASVRSEADRGIHLTTIGFGMGNYNDVLMEQLADRGDGNHYYVDDIGEARRVFVEHLTGTLQTIAKDAKVQVEFDSTRVLRYRLLGFENRDVADHDFRNDKVDAGEIGAGHEVTALYEVKLAPHVSQGTLATVRLRYARPEQDGAGAPSVREIAQRFDAAELRQRFEDAAPRFRLDAAVAELAEILRGSYWAKEGRLSDVLSVARDAARDVHDDAAREFVSLVEKAAKLKKSDKSEAEDGR